MCVAVSAVMVISDLNTSQLSAVISTEYVPASKSTGFVTSCPFTLMTTFVNSAGDTENVTEYFGAGNTGVPFGLKR